MATHNNLTLSLLLCMCAANTITYQEDNNLPSGNNTEVIPDGIRTKKSDDVSATEVLLQQHSQAIEKLQAELTVLKAKTEKLSNVIVYTAQGPPSASLQHGDVVVFHRVITDVGHAYDVKTGTFHVPVTGVYTIYVRTDPRSDSGVKLTLVLNHVEIVNSYGENGSTGGVMVHLRFNKGDTFWVKYSSGIIEGACVLSIALIVPE